MTDADAQTPPTISAPPPPPASAAPIAAAAPAAAPTDAEMARAGAVLQTISDAYSAKMVGQERLRTSLLVALIAGATSSWRACPASPRPPPPARSPTL